MTFGDKYLPLIFWILVVALGTWGSWVIVTGHEKVVENIIPTSNEPVDEIPPAVVDQPILEEVSADGAVRWTLYLDQIVREEGSVMELATPRAIYRFRSGEVLEVTGRTGQYDEESGILNLSGDVTGTARKSEFEFEVDEMVWDSGKGLLTASGGVTITREGLEFTGTDLMLDMAEEFTKLTVTGGVNISSFGGFLDEMNGLEDAS
ncbi:LPS export ABC transporter periplasmic protein LptC [bacterium]|nr:LPS export ABC transporter periplasmic protein LptC [bacterium]